VLHVGLHGGVRESAPDEALGVEDGVLRVHGNLVLGSISDETLGVCECDVGWCGSVALVVGYDLNAVVLPHAHTTVGCAEVNANGLAFCLGSHGASKFGAQRK